MKDKPKTTLLGEGKKLTVATYNLENLAGNQPLRTFAIAESIAHNMKCPDIVALVEIQDNNGVDFEGSSAADRTLDKFISYIPCENAVYNYVNIDPLNHNEGGQPGGNIRVAFIYNQNRVSFTAKGNPGPLTSATISNGELNINPSRVFPNEEWFRGTRKSLVGEFEFNNEKIILVGNHFNSKLGDSSHWNGFQPVVKKSETERGNLARNVNKFVGDVNKYAPNTHVIVLGDFNSLPQEPPMLTLQSGDRLHNLMLYKDLVAPNDRYTTNHNGNSQALDYIFVGNSLLEKNPKLEILHINSDYMGRHSDHDPVLAQFDFSANP